jgi:hypothetical protein
MIVIDPVTNIATVTESPSFMGRMYDGLVGGLQSKNLTGKEAFSGIIAAATLGFVGGSMLTRKRLRDAGDIGDAPAAAPLLYVFG